MSDYRDPLSPAGPGFDYVLMARVALLQARFYMRLVSFRSKETQARARLAMDAIQDARAALDKVQDNVA